MEENESSSISDNNYIIDNNDDIVLEQSSSEENLNIQNVIQDTIFPEEIDNLSGDDEDIVNENIEIIPQELNLNVELNEEQKNYKLDIEKIIALDIQSTNVLTIEMYNLLLELKGNKNKIPLTEETKKIFNIINDKIEIYERYKLNMVKFNNMLNNFFTTEDKYKNLKKVIEKNHFFQLEIKSRKEPKNKLFTNIDSHSHYLLVKASSLSKIIYSFTGNENDKYASYIFKNSSSLMSALYTYKNKLISTGLVFNDDLNILNELIDYLTINENKYVPSKYNSLVNKIVFEIQITDNDLNEYLQQENIEIYIITNPKIVKTNFNQKLYNKMKIIIDTYGEYEFLPTKESKIEIIELVKLLLNNYFSGERVNEDEAKLNDTTVKENSRILYFFRINDIDTIFDKVEDDTLLSILKYINKQKQEKLDLFFPFHDFRIIAEPNDFIDAERYKKDFGFDQRRKKNIIIRNEKVKLFRISPNVIPNIDFIKIMYITGIQEQTNDPTWNYPDINGNIITQNIRYYIGIKLRSVNEKQITSTTFKSIPLNLEAINLFFSRAIHINAQIFGVYSSSDDGEGRMFWEIDTSGFSIVKRYIELGGCGTIFKKAVIYEVGDDIVYIPSHNKKNNCLFVCYNMATQTIITDNEIYLIKQKLGLKKFDPIPVNDIPYISNILSKNIIIHNSLTNQITQTNPNKNLEEINILYDDENNHYYVKLSKSMFKITENRLKDPKIVYIGTTKSHKRTNLYIWYDVETVYPEDDDTNELVVICIRYYITTLDELLSFNEYYKTNKEEAEKMCKSIFTYTPFINNDVVDKFLDVLVSYSLSYNVYICGFNSSGFDNFFVCQAIRKTLLKCIEQDKIRGVNITKEYKNKIVNQLQVLYVKNRIYTMFFSNIRCWDLWLFTRGSLKDVCNGFKATPSKIEGEEYIKIIQQLAQINEIDTTYGREIMSKLLFYNMYDVLCLPSIVSKLYVMFQEATILDKIQITYADENNSFYGDYIQFLIKEKSNTLIYNDKNKIIGFTNRVPKNVLTFCTLGSLTKKYIKEQCPYYNVKPPKNKKRYDWLKDAQTAGIVDIFGEDNFSKLVEDAKLYDITSQYPYVCIKSIHPYLTYMELGKFPCGDEYWIGDKNIALNFLTPEQLKKETFLGIETKRMTYLSNKLLENKDFLEEIKNIENIYNFDINSKIGIYMCYVDMRYLRTPVKGYRNNNFVNEWTTQKTTHFFKLTEIEIKYLRITWKCPVYPIYGLQWPSHCYFSDEYMRYFYQMKREQDIIDFRLKNKIYESEEERKELEAKYDPVKRDFYKLVLNIYTGIVNQRFYDDTVEFDLHNDEDEDEEDMLVVIKSKKLLFERIVIDKKGKEKIKSTIVYQKDETNYIVKNKDGTYEPINVSNGTIKPYYITKKALPTQMGNYIYAYARICIHYPLNMFEADYGDTDSIYLSGLKWKLFEEKYKLLIEPEFNNKLSYKKTLEHINNDLFKVGMFKLEHHFQRCYFIEKKFYCGLGCMISCPKLGKIGCQDCKDKKCNDIQHKCLYKIKGEYPKASWFMLLNGKSLQNDYDKKYNFGSFVNKIKETILYEGKNLTFQNGDKTITLTLDNVEEQLKDKYFQSNNLKEEKLYVCRYLGNSIYTFAPKILKKTKVNFQIITTDMYKELLPNVEKQSLQININKLTQSIEETKDKCI